MTLFTLMEKTRSGDAIFIDLQGNTNFYFLVKIIKEEEDISVSLSYGYKNIEWASEEMLENSLPLNIQEEAKRFGQQVIAYANLEHAEFMAELKEAGLYSDPLHEEDNSSAFRP
ncbi:hypothetical protein [Legionella sp. km772]|uniref:hypothetical protein n=1 Tax=Legionella sp. km772 TaxID=2498111 RepID=UPI000FA9B6B2|nr:hypothetical protein [Legionella sp. km772]RUR08620.1 hypothetical protein ELY15_10465 [Legionella sp. km772]